jgi:hypothetical protein
MLNLKIQKLLDEFNNSPIVKYYEEKGERKASAAALSKLRMERGLASKMAKASIKVGGHIKGNKAMREAGGHIKGGYVSIAQLLKWQKDNDFRVCDLERTDKWKANISKAHIGKKISKETIEKLREKKTLFGTKDAWNKGKTGYKTKPHSEETKQKMREKALGRIISESQRKKASKINSVPIIATNLKSGKTKQYKSTKEAKEKLGLTGILHVLKGRSKQCGGYYFEYKN